MTDQFCGTCGVRRHTTQPYCTSCGAAFSALAPSTSDGRTLAGPTDTGLTSASSAANQPTLARGGPRTIGRYLVDQVVGQGGFGTVYRGRHPISGHPVAIKVLDQVQALEGTDGARARLLREVDALRTVDSSWCVRVIDVVDDDGVLAIVTDYVDGASLRTVLAERGRLSGPEALTALDGALRGLTDVHRRGLVHGDLKPDNILLTADGRSHLIDFGLVGPPRPLAAGAWIATGSPGYLSPEHIRGERIDTPTDSYAFGVMLFELLLGRRPFEAPTTEGLLALHLHHPAPDPRGIDPVVGEQLAQLCLDCLDKDPARRPAYAPQLLERLEAGAIERYGADWRSRATLGAVAAAAGAGGAVVGNIAAGAGAVAGSGAAAGGGGSVITGTAATGVGAKIAAAVAVAAVAAGGGYVATQALDKDDDASVAARAADLDPYAYVTNDTALVVMAGGKQVARVESESTPSWSPDGRYVVTVSGGRVSLVDVVEARTETAACSGCTSAAVWDGRVATVAGSELSARPIDDLTAARPVATASDDQTWARLLPAGNDLLAFGDDGSLDGYRGGPLMVTDVITPDGEVTRIDDQVSASSWGPEAAYSSESAYGGPRAAVTDAGSGGACVHPANVTLFDPAHPARSTSTDTSAMAVNLPDTQEYFSLTDLWFDGDGVLRASGDTLVCGLGTDTLYNVHPLESRQQVWRLEGSTWVADDDRSLMSTHVLPSGDRLELERVTGTQPGDRVGDLTLTTADGTSPVATEATRVITPALPSGAPLEVPVAPALIDFGYSGAGSVKVDGRGDSTGLEETPPEFQDFIADLARSTYDDAVAQGYGDECGGIDATPVTVQRYDPTGFASGGAGACSGYQAIWAREDGRWTEVLGSQSGYACDELREHQVPARLIADEGVARCNRDGVGDEAYYQPASAVGPSESTPSGTASGDPRYATDCGTPPTFTPISSTSAAGNLVVSMRVSATCPGGQRLDGGAEVSVIGDDGQVYATGRFDFSQQPLDLPAPPAEDGDPDATNSVDQDLTYPADAAASDPQELNEAIDGGVVHVDCTLEEPVTPSDSPDPSAPAGPSSGTDETEDELTADAPGSELDQRSALDRLRAIARRDRSSVRRDLQGAWAPQLASALLPGPGRTAGVQQPRQILTTYLKLQLRYGDVYLLDTSDWDYQFPDSFAVVANESRSTWREVLTYCTPREARFDNCGAKFLRRSDYHGSYVARDKTTGQIPELLNGPTNGGRLRPGQD